MLCYSLEFFIGNFSERSLVSREPVRAPYKPPAPVIWFNDQKIVDTLDILLIGL